MVLPNAHGALRVDDECDRRKSWTCWARTFTLCAGSMRPYPPPRWPQWAAGTRLRQIELGPPLRRQPDLRASDAKICCRLVASV